MRLMYPSMRTVTRWTRHEVGATGQTICSALTGAVLTCTYGYEDPPVIVVGTTFHDKLVAQVNLSRRATNRARNGAYESESYLRTTVGDVDEPPLDDLSSVDIFMGCKIVVDAQQWPLTAKVYMWDRETYDFPILFVGATVTLSLESSG